MFRTWILATLVVVAAFAQPPGGQPNPNLKSTEVGGHTWINWRLYLRDFTQVLFR